MPRADEMVKANCEGLANCTLALTSAFLEAFNRILFDMKREDFGYQTSGYATVILDSCAEQLTLARHQPAKDYDRSNNSEFEQLTGPSTGFS